MFYRFKTLYRNAYSGLSPAVWIQALIMLINRSGTMVIPFMTIYLTESLHFSIAQAGAVLSVFGVGAIAGVYAGGKLTDKIGFFPVQCWSLVLNGVLFIVMRQLSHFVPICVCVFLLACIGEAFRPANAAATAHYSSPENRTRSYSLNRLAINLGFAIGPAAGGLLAALSFSWLFWTDGLTCIAAALALFWWLGPPKAAEGSDRVDVLQPGVTAAPVPLLSAYKDRTYLVFIFFVWMNALSFFQLFSVVPLYYKKVVHLSDFGIGLILSMNGLLIALIEMVLVYRLEKKQRDLHYIGWGVLLTALSFLSLAAGGGALWIAVLSMLFITFGEMMSMPFMNSFWISRSSAQNRGQYAALYGMAYSAAQVIGPSMGALVAEHVGFTWLWVILVGVGLLTYGGFRYAIVSERS